MSFDEDKLKSMWEESTPEINEDDALKKVLSTSAKVTGVKDITSLFVGWIWVVFLGFGASMYSAKRKFDQQNLNNQKLNNKNVNTNGELK